MPFTLEGGVVASIAEHVTYGRKITRHVFDKSVVRVVEHTGLGDVATGIDHRPTRCRYIRASIVLLECRTNLAQTLTGGIVAIGGILLHISLLIGGDEDDVVLAVGIRRRLVGVHGDVLRVGTGHHQCSAGRYQRSRSECLVLLHNDNSFYDLLR